MRIIFAGTPEFAARALAALIEAGHDIPLVLSQPDRPAGRGMKTAPGPVKELALRHGLSVSQPRGLKEQEVRAGLAALRPDAMVVAAYGLLLPKEVLSIPRFGCLNIHASLLPRWRGAAPIQRALLAGDRETGISIMQMDEGLDTGAVLMAVPLPIAEGETAQTLHDKLAVLGAEAIVTALDGIARGELRGRPQDESKATYAAKLSKAEGRLDWRSTADQLTRAVRAYNPFPVAHGVLNGEQIRIWDAAPAHGGGAAPGQILRADREGVLVACGQGALLIRELQKTGGKRLPAERFLPGNPLKPGDRFDP